MRKSKNGAKPRRVAEPDVNQLAHHLVKMTTEGMEPAPVPDPSDAEISRVMAALGRRGGKIGGKARADSMTAARRHEIAQKAARSRWGVAVGS
jgi:hypothetical protein